MFLGYLPKTWEKSENGEIRGKLKYFSKGALVCLVETACGHRPVICRAPGSYGVIQGVFNNMLLFL